MEDVSPCAGCHWQCVPWCNHLSPPSVLQYVKDVVLPRVLDDQTFSTLCSLILFNNVDVSWCWFRGGVGVRWGGVGSGCRPDLLHPPLSDPGQQRRASRVAAGVLRRGLGVLRGPETMPGVAALQVLMALQADPTFFPELFRRLRTAQPSTEEWRDLVTFLQVGWGVELGPLATLLQEWGGVGGVLVGVA